MRHLSVNCVRYVSGIDGLYAVGFEWPAIEVIARSAGIRLNPLLLEKMRVLENLTIKYFNNKKGGAADG